MESIPQTNPQMPLEASRGVSLVIYILNKNKCKFTYSMLQTLICLGSSKQNLCPEYDLQICKILLYRPFYIWFIFFCIQQIMMFS